MADVATGLLLRGLLADGAVRLLAVDVTQIARHTRRLHGLGPDASRLAAEALVAAALASAHIKGEEQLTLQIQGQEPRCSVYVDATGEGDLRARVTPADLTLGPGGTLSGILLIIKHVPGGQTYRGATRIERGSTLEEALAAHLRDSDQVQAVLRIGVRGNVDGGIDTAAGVLFEPLPEEPGLPSLSEAAFTTRYGRVADSDWRTVFTEVAMGVVGGEPVEVLARTALQFKCRCDPERVEAVLVSLGVDALRQMLEEDRGAEVTCDFCTSVVQLTEARLAELLSSIAPET